MQHDAVIEGLILAATEELEQATRRRFDRHEITDDFDTRHTYQTDVDLLGCSESGTVVRSSRQTFTLTGLFPDQTEGAQVFYDPKGAFGPDTEVDGALFRIDWVTGKFDLLRGTIQTVRGLRVVYTAGIEPDNEGTLSGTAPDALKLACKFQTAFLFKRHRADNVGLTVDRGVVSEKTAVATGRWNVSTGLCREAQGLVRRFRMPILGRG
ncbi:hypothetical protein AQY21_20705 [Paracoccus sp. MKU1]|nr:hypothetical protein AQY21_20705 [Paracoccus sp. MKU1]